MPIGFEMSDEEAAEGGFLDAPLQIFTEMHCISGDESG